MTLTRFDDNPIMLPDHSHPWEAEAAFNCCPVEDKGIYHLLYRAISSPMRWQQTDNLMLSSIGHATSSDALHFDNRTQFIKPEYEWEKFGCEDPRVTKIDGKFYIFYTAISTMPPTPEGIRVALAITSDFKEVEQKRLITHFNAKAMTLFPEKINGKFCALLTVDTDYPPAKIGVVYFDNPPQMWDILRWMSWKDTQSSHIIPLQRDIIDHIEIGAQPIKTDRGWLLIYSYIKNYLSNKKIFGIEAVLLDSENPLKVIGRTHEPLLVPEKYYEIYGQIPNVVFPSGVLQKADELYVYYGACDTTCCVAIGKISEILEKILPEKITYGIFQDKKEFTLTRFEGNPIISPVHRHTWDSKATLNAASIVEDNKVHIFYRAQGIDDTSVVGYALSLDGLHIEERLEQPVYTPREPFEMKTKPGNSGCEDPRLVKLDNTYYMFYTAFEGITPRIALSTILVDDLRNRRWNWSTPKLISAPDVSNKDSCIFPQKFGGKYAVLHRIEPSIWIDFVDDLDFSDEKWVAGSVLCAPREGKWDDVKIGIAGPPFLSDLGWILIYHAITKSDRMYRLGVIVLEKDDPTRILLRTDFPILEPQMPYENTGIRPGTVFSNGQALLNDELFVYYGAGDSTLAVARIDYHSFLEKLHALL